MPQQTPRASDRRVSRARELRRDATDAERKLWQHLRQPPFKEHHFRRQAPIGPFFSDFASHKLRLIIEVDGGQHAESAADARRSALLASSGYRIIRFWNHDVLSNVEGVSESILAAIEQASPPTPNPSPPPCSASGYAGREGGEKMH